MVVWKSLEAAGAEPGTSAAEPLLTSRPSTARQRLAASVLVLGLLLGLLLAAPHGDRPLAGTAPLLLAYAGIVLMVDLIAATLLLAQFAVHGLPALLVLAIGYLVSGLTVLPWVVTFPDVLAPDGLLGAGLQTTAMLAALRRLALPLALLGYALLQRRRRRRPWRLAPARMRLVLHAAVLGSLAFTFLATWLAVAGEWLAPPLMTDRHASTILFSYVLILALALILLAAAALLLRPGPPPLLDLWLLVTLATLACEIVLLGLVGAGVRFSPGWWAGRMFGLLATGIVMLVLLAETTTLHARLVRTLLAESRARDARASLLEALAAALAHELNQPLAGIVTSADAAARWLDRPVPDHGEALARLRRIAAEGHAAAEIVAGLRRAFGKQPSHYDRLDVGTLVREAAAARSLPGLRLDLPPGLPPVLGDAVPLRQAIGNLLCNAADAVAMVDTGPRLVHVACSHEMGEVRITVGDTGPGLDPAIQEHLFAPFVSTKPGGMGLGLMICRTIVEAHGGRVTARANRPRGAILEIRLPCAPLRTEIGDG